MPKWIKVDESSDGSATFIDLKKAVRFDFRPYSSGDGGRVRVYFAGNDLDVASDRDPEAYEAILDYLDFKPERRQAERREERAPDRREDGADDHRDVEDDQ